MNHTYSVNGTRLSYQTRGSGEAVIFLHPTPLNRDYWTPLTDRLQGVYAVAPDLRGHGASELGGELPVGGFELVPDVPVLSMAQYATDVIALLDHLEISKAVFAGCSIGGYILLELWRRIPQRVKGLAFVCSKPQPDTEPGRAKRAENIAKARAGGLAELLDGSARSLTGESSRKEHPDLAAHVRASMVVTPEAFVAIQAGLAMRPDSLPMVATITVPVLAIAGGEDGAVTPAEMEALKAVPGGCDFHLLEHAGHFAALERPDEVAEIFSGWLRENVIG